MKNLTDILTMSNKYRKAIRDVTDWHIAFLHEPDAKKQQLYYTIYESKRKVYDELKAELTKLL